MFCFLWYGHGNDTYCRSPTYQWHHGEIPYFFFNINWESQLHIQVFGMGNFRIFLAQGQGIFPELDQWRICISFNPSPRVKGALNLGRRHFLFFSSYFLHRISSRVEPLGTKERPGDWTGILSISITKSHIVFTNTPSFMITMFSFTHALLNHAAYSVFNILDKHLVACLWGIRLLYSSVF